MLMQTLPLDVVFIEHVTGVWRGICYPIFNLIGEMSEQLLISNDAILILLTSTSKMGAPCSF